MTLIGLRFDNELLYYTIYSICCFYGRKGEPGESGSEINVDSTKNDPPKSM